ncbi:MAG: PhzF family phenazine biosynthesis protein [Haloferacaceae archaeon]
MTDRRALLVDAFADEPLAGNAAGVVPDADDLTDEQMRAVARELGASETAFVRSSPDADRRLRFFSPSAEVDLCGHATVAAHAHLHREGVLAAGVHAVETNAGVFDVEVEEGGVVWLAGAAPEVTEVEVDLGRVGDALGIDPAALRDVGADLPTAVASTGLPYLVVPVNFLERLSGADPDDAAVAALAEEHGAAGVYAFTFDAIDRDSTLHGRAFVPALGVSEDPVTGTASGAVAAYCRAVGAFDGDVPDEIRCEQGHFLDRPGVVRVRFGTGDDDGRDDTAGDDGDAGPVWVGGTAVTALDGRLAVPDDDGDGIIEA